jgi:hypothetical protein
LDENTALVNEENPSVFWTFTCKQDALFEWLDIDDDGEIREEDEWDGDIADSDLTTKSLAAKSDNSRKLLDRS